MATEKAPKKISLALSGGGVRAVAHLGVVEVLQQQGYDIAAIAGSSGGALAGVLLCDGYTPREVLEIYRELRRIDLVRHFRQGGVFALKGIERLLSHHLTATHIEELRTPCIITATDLTAGTIRYFDRGPIAKLAAASSSLIPFFAPVSYEGMRLGDGGFMDNMPVRALKAQGVPILGINVNAILPQEPKNVMQTTYRALILMMAANVEASKHFADAYLEIQGCAEMNIFDTSKLDSAFDAGRREAEAALKKGLLDLA
ncbi:patatin-like phospholipase family protein [Sulfurimonas diazotrophicus]|uniref:Patatin-like phospholipase family protein n=1 Tax=Sulfurimonas diazotrophicus TaxID=3131939 RepID=A0ABZ3HCA9_9BACT